MLNLNLPCNEFAKKLSQHIAYQLNQEENHLGIYPSYPKILSCERSCGRIATLQSLDGVNDPSTFCALHCIPQSSLANPVPSGTKGIELPQVSWVDHTSSTNSDLLNYLREGGSSTQVRGAWQQSAGRGRANRSWIGTPGQSLLMSLALRLNLPLERMLPLPLVAGIAATEALLSFLPFSQHKHLQLKWPNDILWQGAKLAGILVETVSLSKPSPLKGVVLGIGVNLSGASLLSQQLDRPIADWSSIRSACNLGSELTNSTVLRLASATVCTWLKNLVLLGEHGFQPFISRFDALDALKHSPVTLVDHQQQLIFSGQARGINQQGLLRVYSHDLQIERCFAAGEVSLQTNHPNIPTPLTDMSEEV